MPTDKPYNEVSTWDVMCDLEDHTIEELLQEISTAKKSGATHFTISYDGDYSAGEQEFIIRFYNQEAKASK